MENQPSSDVQIEPFSCLCLAFLAFGEASQQFPLYFVVVVAVVVVVVIGVVLTGVLTGL